MPMPWTYRHPEKEWRLFLDDIREVMGTPSSNVAYTAAEGVFGAFRSRLDVVQALGFAQVLPAVPRALFVQGWEPAPPVPWADRRTYLAEAKALRADHNFIADTAVEAVSYALNRALRPDVLAKALARIGPEAEAFWRLTGYSEADLTPGIR
ncbi:DUF2267 domain-containing protein [Salipiger abyssi]|uniref:DUF2267 domain-containing protein n=1 Tax=Salipiger abyssi TaxID=1250539 RepID=A0A1P8URF8_9RHOB|nr:DUF2267 domain-containing protein [Salipiger abyssi]APZ51990.1 hypothetical protein Ga0080574_TMP1656 [Salipiger abyssi]